MLTACGSSASGSHQAMPRPCASPSETGTWDPELLPLSPPASRIGELGQSRYASAFAGVQLFDGARVLVVYVVPGHAAAFLKAVAAADTRGLCYSVKNVRRSYATQAATSKWIAAHLGVIGGEGIALAFWGPSPSDDAVRVAVQAPTSRRLAQLRIAVARVRKGYLAKRPLELPVGTPVVRATYKRVVAAVLNAEAPSPDDIVLFPTLLGPAHAAAADS
jgi:hypothetical protein